MKFFLQCFTFVFIFFNLQAIQNQPTKQVSIAFSKKIDPQKIMTPTKCVISTKKITIEAYPDAFNPSICKIESGYLLLFRYCPDRRYDVFSIIGLVRLNENFEPVSEPQLLDTRFFGTLISPHAEDPRIFSIKGKLYITYNDSPHVFLPGGHDRRDIYIAELVQDNDLYSISLPVKLKHLTKYDAVRVQKNWVPFEWNDELYMIYSAQPHEILYTNLETGVCTPIYRTFMAVQWPLGIIRGGTPALLIDGEYLSFFHSSHEITSDASQGKKMLHYFMGAYTFGAAPPFAITKISEIPIIGENFYTNSGHHKRVVFPAGFVASKQNIDVVFGKDDKEIWRATIDKELLQKTLIPAQ